MMEIFMAILVVVTSAMVIHDREENFPISRVIAWITLIISIITIFVFIFS